MKNETIRQHSMPAVDRELKIVAEFDVVDRSVEQRRRTGIAGNEPDLHLGGDRNEILKNDAMLGPLREFPGDRLHQ